MLDLVLLLKLAILAHQVFQPSACEAHDTILEREDLVCLIRLSHASISLFLVHFKDKGVHIRVHDGDWLVCAKIVLDCLTKLFHFSLHALDLLVDLFELRAELWVNDVVVLLGFADIDALFQHGLQLGEFLKCGIKRVDNLGSERVLLISHVLIKV